jgi:arylsulfatase A-like enzyme
MMLPRNQVTFPEILKSGGYETAFIGKWHNNDLGRDRGFDYQFGFRGQGRYMDPGISENFGPEIRYSGHITDILTDKAVEFIERAHSKPFCLLLWFKAPHRSFQPAPRFRDMYRDSTIPFPKNYSDDYTGRPQAVANANMRIGDFPDIPDYQTFVKDYYRCLAGVDENVGRVLEALDRSGLTDDTVVVYSGDNGFFIGEHHFFDKRFMYEESIRVPLLIRYPGMIREGRISSEMVLNADLAPTLLDLAGVSPPPDMAGSSLKPLLEGRDTPWRDDFLYEYYEYPGAHSGRMNRGIRNRRWKYIHFFEEPQEIELYDLENDPQEMVNLAHLPENRDVRETLARRMQELRAETNDPDW